MRMYAALVFGVIGSVVTCAEASPTFLEQHWEAPDRQWFYTTSQGSQIMPYSWFMALEDTDSQSRFMRDGLERFGYIPNAVASLNPDALPVGLVKDKRFLSEDYIGLTCAACHTGQISYQNTRIQIDGAPTLADMGQFIAELDRAIQATLKDELKFARFAGAVLKADHSPESALLLKERLTAFGVYWNQFVKDSTPKVPWGRARLDAFGMIFNRVSAINTKVQENSCEPNAPVSYPFLWGTSFEDKVQWNGIAPNGNDLERLARNVGEVLGVFASADLTQKATPIQSYYNTSALRVNQIRLENQLKRLWSPKWPQEVLGMIDPDKQAKGQVLFRNNCMPCHEIVPHGEQSRRIMVTMTPLRELKTDPTMAVNVAKRMSKTGPLEGAKFLFNVLGAGLPKEMPTSELLAHVVIGAILDPTPVTSVPVYEKSKLFQIAPKSVVTDEMFLDSLSPLDSVKLELYGSSDNADETMLGDVEGYLSAYKTESRGIQEDSPQMKVLGLTDKEVESLAYKGRPLDGIWATAPFMHNGSIPNLYQILLPPEKRVKEFFVGSPEFDPKLVGFITEENAESTKFDTSLEGNSNLGHDYGNADFSEDERWQLVEYMKGL